VTLTNEAVDADDQVLAVECRSAGMAGQSASPNSSPVSSWGLCGGVQDVTGVPVVRNVLNTPATRACRCLFEALLQRLAVCFPA
jgi:hypothetical protein